MNLLARFRSWLRWMGNGRKLESEMETELRFRMAKGVAKVAAARRLAVRLFWMLRTNTQYPKIVHIESSSALAVVSES